MSFHHQPTHLFGIFELSLVLQHDQLSSLHLVFQTFVRNTHLQGNCRCWDSAYRLDCLNFCTEGLESFRASVWTSEVLDSHPFLDFSTPLTTRSLVVFTEGLELFRALRYLSFATFSLQATSAYFLHSRALDGLLSYPFLDFLGLLISWVLDFSSFRPEGLNLISLKTSEVLWAGCSCSSFFLDCGSGKSKIFTLLHLFPAGESA